MKSGEMSEAQQRNARRLYATPFAKIWPMLVAKVERKGRTREEAEQVACWLTGHDAQSLAAALASDVTVEDFFGQAPALNPARGLITGTVCGVRVEEVQDPIMREVRYLDKLIDELAKGKAMEKVLRG